MKVTSKFEIKDKRKLTMYIIAGIFFGIMLINFVATSWFSFDDLIATKMFPGMKYLGIRLWTGWTVLDGYIQIMGWMLPVIYLVLVSPWKWLQKNKKNSWWSIHWNLHYVLLAIITLIYACIAVFMAHSGFYQDSGFGDKGLNVEFILGDKIILTMFIISLAINFITYSVMTWYVETRVITAKDFLDRKIWRQAWVIILCWIMMSIIVFVLKWGFGRPYWYNIHFTDEGGTLSLIRDNYHDQYLHYINQTNGNYGWTYDYPNGKTIGIGGWNDIGFDPWPDDEQFQPWWLPTNGVFSPNRSHYLGHMPGEESFPSGHMIATTVAASSFTIFFYNRKRTKKSNVVYIILAIIGYLYIFDMLFALTVSTSHWWSDSTFTLGFMPFIYIAAYYITNCSFNALNKRFKVNNY